MDQTCLPRKSSRCCSRVGGRASPKSAQRSFRTSHWWPERGCGWKGWYNRSSMSWCACAFQGGRWRV